MILVYQSIWNTTNRAIVAWSARCQQSGYFLLGLNSAKHWDIVSFLLQFRTQVGCHCLQNRRVDLIASNPLSKSEIQQSIMRRHTCILYCYSYLYICQSRVCIYVWLLEKNGFKTAFLFCIIYWERLKKLPSRLQGSLRSHIVND